MKKTKFIFMAKAAMTLTAAAFLGSAGTKIAVAYESHWQADGDAHTQVRVAESEYASGTESFQRGVHFQNFALANQYNPYMRGQVVQAMQASNAHYAASIQYIANSQARVNSVIASPNACLAAKAEAHELYARIFTYQAACERSRGNLAGAQQNEAAAQAASSSANAVRQQFARQQLFEKGVAEVNSGNYERAKSYFQDSANAGNAEAMFMLGSMYQLGVGVPQSSSQSHRFYEEAASKGFVEAKIMTTTVDEDDDESPRPASSRGRTVRTTRPPKIRSLEISEYKQETAKLGTTRIAAKPKSEQLKWIKLALRAATKGKIK